jgi:hypothetical protein
MPNIVLTTAQRSEVNYIAVAADLAAAMIRELESLQSDNDHLALLMDATGSSAQQQLSSVLRILEWLALARNPEEVAHLIARARALLVTLANELEQLSSAATCDCEPSASPRIGLRLSRSLFHFEATNELAYRTPSLIVTRAPTYFNDIEKPYHASYGGGS